MKIVEFYPEKQGRPISPTAVSFDEGGLGIPEKSINSILLSSTALDHIITYEGEVVCYEGKVLIE